MDKNDTLYSNLLRGKLTKGGGMTPTGSITITQNGTKNVSQYATAVINVPQPSGTITINGTGLYNVYNYANAQVNGISERYVNVWVNDDNPDYGYIYLDYNHYFYYNPSMTWAQFISSEYNPIVNASVPVKMFYSSGNMVYMHIPITNEMGGGITCYDIQLEGHDETWEDGGYVRTNWNVDDWYYFVYYSGGGGECIVRGTKILTADGEKKVEDIKSGDTVTSINPDNPDIVELRQVNVCSTRGEALPVKQRTCQRYYEFTFDDGTSIKVTGKHRFFNVETQHFEWIQDFKTGDRIYKIDGTTPALVSSKTVEEECVYECFWCDDNLNYFVNGVLSGNRRHVTIGEFKGGLPHGTKKTRKYEDTVKQQALQKKTNAELRKTETLKKQEELKK